MSQCASTAHAIAATPPCAVGGPRRGAGIVNGSSMTWPASSTAGSAGSVNGSDSTSDARISTQLHGLLDLGALDPLPRVEADVHVAQALGDLPQALG